MRKKIITFLFSFFVFTSFADIFVVEKYNFALDFPEGFALIENIQDDSFMFSHTQLPVDVIFRFFPKERFASCKESLETSYKLLGGTGNSEEFIWGNTTAAIGNFSMSNGQNRFGGWAVAIELPQYNTYALVFSYTTFDKQEILAQFLVSVIDSISIDKAGFSRCGPLSVFAFPKEEEQEITISVNNQKITTTINKVDVEASKYLIDREYAILTLYGQSELWQEAWKRYYRLIYRDSFPRLQKVADSFYEILWPVAMKTNFDNPDLAYGQLILTWLQSFSYKRDFSQSDFTPLPAILLGEGSDCDSRAMLGAILLGHLNYHTNIFISPEFKHALLGFEVEGIGAHLEEGGIQYLLGETTAKVNFGLIAQDMAVKEKWFGVLLAW